MLRSLWNRHFWWPRAKSNTVPAATLSLLQWVCAKTSSNRSHFNVYYLWGAKSQLDIVCKSQLFEEREEPKQNQTERYKNWTVSPTFRGMSEGTTRAEQSGRTTAAMAESGGRRESWCHVHVAEARLHPLPAQRQAEQAWQYWPRWADASSWVSVKIGFLYFCCLPG